MHLLDRALRVTDKPREIATTIKIDRSRLRQTYVAGGSVKELHPQPLLQVLHLLADPRLRCSEALRCSGEASPLDDFNEG